MMFIWTIGDAIGAAAVILSLAGFGFLRLVIWLQDRKLRRRS